MLPSRLSHSFVQRICAPGLVAYATLDRLPCASIDRYSKAPYSAPRALWPTICTVPLPTLSQKPSGSSAGSALASAPPHSVPKASTVPTTALPDREQLRASALTSSRLPRMPPIPFCSSCPAVCTGLPAEALRTTIPDGAAASMLLLARPTRGAYRSQAFSRPRLGRGPAAGRAAAIIRATWWRSP